MAEPVPNPRPQGASVSSPDETGDYQTQAAQLGTTAGLAGSANAAGNSSGGRGRFTIIRPHAEGGLGRVSLARDEDLRREVALKEIRPEWLDSPNARERFLNEAEITGRLEHPGIVPIYALGQDEAGRPYYAMRFIQGRTLAEAIDAYHRSAEGGAPAAFDELLRRFESVCQTMAYAHSKRVIHRDLKPANVMLGDFGETLVLDWGLAKRVMSDESRVMSDKEQWPDSALSTQHSALTQLGQALGTPAYMAPEQARGEVDRLDERCDVFGLGAILCQLLTGRAPFVDTDALRVIEKGRQGDLNDAFSRLDRCGAGAELVALAKRCLAPEPNDRPRGAGQVAKELTAYRASVQERLKAAEIAEAAAQAKAVEERKRRRVSLALAAAVLMLVVGAGAVAIWYQRDRADRLTDEARLQAESAARRSQLERDAAAAIDEADSMLAQLRQQLKDPFLAAKLLDEPGRWQGGLDAVRSRLSHADGLLAKAEGNVSPELTARLAALQERSAADERDRQWAFELERIRTDAASLVEGKFDVAQAGPRYRAAFAKAGFQVASGDLSTLAKQVQDSPLRWLLVATLDHWTDVTPDFQLVGRLLHLARAADPDPWRDRFRTLAVWNDRDKLAELAADPAAALQSPPILVALATRLGARGGDPAPLLRAALLRHPRDFWLLFALGDTGVGLPEGETGYRAALAVRPHAVVALNNLGGSLERQKRIDEAIACYRQVTEIEPRYAAAHNNLGTALGRQNQHDAAIACFRRAIAADADYFHGHFNLSIALQRLKRFEEAVPYAKRAVDLRPNHTGALKNLGNALGEAGSLDEAVDCLNIALKREPNDPLIHESLGVALERQNKLDDAIAAFRRALELDPKLASAHCCLGTALFAQAKPDEAVASHQRAIALEPENSRFHNQLGVVLSAQQEIGQAEVCFRKAVELDSNNREALYNLGNLFGQQGKHSEAVACYHKVLAIDPIYAPAHNKLGLIAAIQGRHDEALVHYQRALKLDPEFAEAHCLFGLALQELGRFSEALASLKHGHALGSKSPRWRHPSERWIKVCEDLVVRDGKLAAVLSGEMALLSPDDQLIYARLCTCKQQYAAAARLFADAFAADAKLAPAFGYHGARVAVLAATGQGTDADKVSDSQREGLRKQALAWLQADFVARRKRVDDDPAARNSVLPTVKAWQTDRDLAAVRDQATLGKLPETERETWRQFWAEVDAFVMR